MIKVSVTRISIPAMSTIGYGEGLTVGESGAYHVVFVGDHRLMRDIGEALRTAEDPVVADVPTINILSQQSVPGGQS